MIPPHDLADLARRLAAAGIAELEVRAGPDRWRLVVEAAPPPAVAMAARPPEAFALAAGIGRLRLAHPRGGRPAAEGDAVRRGQVVAWLQAGPLLQPVLAGDDGRLGPPLLAEDALVGHGDRVFAVLPA